MPPALVKDHLDLIEVASPCGKPVDTLLVLLPGAYDTAQDFQTHGFTEAVRHHRIAADLVLADAHIGYYTNGSIYQRLQDDIVTPARAKGYSKIWLAGISLGGYGSLIYGKHYGEDLSGMFLMAPFLGNRSLIAEVDRAGGLANWQPGEIAPGDYDRRLWSWIKGYTQQPEKMPPLYIGYGTGDRFAGSDAMLAKALPPEQVSTTPGGHEWAPWLRLWNGFLARDVLPKCPRSSG